MTEKIKIYNIPRDSKIYCEPVDGSSFVKFIKMDGAYAYCITEKGGISHIGSRVPLLKHKDGYKFLKQQASYIDQFNSWTKKQMKQLLKRHRDRNKN